MELLHIKLGYRATMIGLRLYWVANKKIKRDGYSLAQFRSATLFSQVLLRR